MEVINLNHTWPSPAQTFKEWLKLVEDEQVSSNVLKSKIINRQLLYHFWTNGYSPVDAIRELQGDEDK
jgi:hypothetical protein